MARPEILGVSLIHSASIYYEAQKGWFLIAATAFIAVGMMLIGSGMTGRASRLGDALFVAVPGVFLAAVGFTFVKYLQPFDFALTFVFTWEALAFLGQS